MIELNLMDALVAVGQALAFTSLLYFFYLTLMHGDALRHAAHEGDTRPLRDGGRERHLAELRGEPEHAAPGNVLDEIAAAAVRMARSAR